MKIKFYLGFFLATLFILPVEAQLRNLVQNGSFEFMDKDTVRESPGESWTFTTEYDNVAGHVTQSRALDRFRSYLIRAEEGRGYLTSDTFKIERRERYLLSFAVCGNGIIETEILWWQEENDTLTVLENEFLDASSTSDDWGILQFNVRSPRRASAASVRFSVFDGQVWIDDVRFREDVLFR